MSFDAAIERLRKDSATDPVLFARVLNIQPDPWQQRVLRSTARRMLLNCSRQAGKTTVTIIGGLHCAVFEPGTLQLIISPSERQSKELLRKMRSLLKAIPWGCGVAKDNVFELELENGSRVVSLPDNPDTIRGFAGVRRVIEDEAAFVPDSLAAAVSPMLAVSGGQRWMLSTPNGRHGHFFDAWEHGGDDWIRERITAHDVPRITAEFLASERRTYELSGRGEQFKQEYMCEFVNAASGRVYSQYDSERNVIQAAPADINTHRGRYHFVLGIDFGIVDPCAFTVLAWRDHDPCVYVLESYRLPDCSPTMAAEEVRRLETRYAFEAIVGDVGGMGKSFQAEASRRFGLPIDPAQKQNKPGYIALLNGDLARGKLKVLAPTCAHLIEEWLTLPWAQPASWEPGDTHGDRMHEAPGYANHAADSCLYAWRRAYAFMESPLQAPPKPNTAEAHAAEAEALYENRQQWLRKRDEWDDF